MGLDSPAWSKLSLLWSFNWMSQMRGTKADRQADRQTDMYKDRHHPKQADK